MSKHISNQTVASAENTMATDIAREMDVSAGVTHVANGAADISVAIDQSAGHQFLTIVPQSVGEVTEFSLHSGGDVQPTAHETASLFHNFGDAQPVNAENISSGAQFMLLTDTSHDQNPLSQYGISDDNLGNFNSDHLANIFDNLSVGPGDHAGNDAGAWSHGVSVNAEHAEGALDISFAHDANTTHGGGGVSSHGGGHTGGGGGGTGGGGTGGGTPTSFTINLSWDASVASAPAGFKTAVQDVVSFYESHFSDHVTLNISVGYGEVAGLAIGAGAIAESGVYLTSASYSTIVNALKADATSSYDQSAVASPAGDRPKQWRFMDRYDGGGQGTRSRCGGRHEHRRVYRVQQPARTLRLQQHRWRESWHV